MRLTIEEIYASPPLRQWVAGLLKNESFSAILDALERQSVPDINRLAAPIPGVHYDTCIAHDLHFKAGIAWVISQIRDVGGTRQITPEEAPMEEPWSHSAEVQAIDREHEQISKAAKSIVPPKPRSRSK